jgi:hypothetical protein
MIVFLLFHVVAIGLSAIPMLVLIVQAIVTHAANCGQADVRLGIRYAIIPASVSAVVAVALLWGILTVSDVFVQHAKEFLVCVSPVLSLVSTFLVVFVFRYGCKGRVPLGLPRNSMVHASTTLVVFVTAAVTALLNVMPRDGQVAPSIRDYGWPFTCFSVHYRYFQVTRRWEEGQWQGFGLLENVLVWLTIVAGIGILAEWGRRRLGRAIFKDLGGCGVEPRPAEDSQAPACGPDIVAQRDGRS